MNRVKTSRTHANGVKSINLTRVLELAHAAAASDNEEKVWQAVEYYLKEAEQVATRSTKVEPVK